MFDEQVDQATSFRSYDAPDGERLDGSEQFQDYYDRLGVANTLNWNGKWRDEHAETKRNALAIVDAVAGQLQLTDFQSGKARVWFTELPDKFNESRSTGLLALCICALVAREDGRTYHPNQYHDGSDVENNFVRVADDLDVTYSQLSSCWSAVKSEVTDANGVS
jgi:hypothetical protein